MSRCDNIRCTGPVRYVARPYGIKRDAYRSCARHLGPLVASLLRTYGGPILLYAESEGTQ